VAALSGQAHGETPLTEEDLAGLKPSWIATRADLNAAEQEGILDASRWLLSSRHLPAVDTLLTAAFADRLHKRMFGGVWRWAGQRRQRVTNIGVEPYQITTKLRDVFDDARYWHLHTDHGMDRVEIAVRLHHRLVAVHPYPNGNGRHARLMADALLRRYEHDPLPWGGRDLGEASATRAAYIQALQQADRGDYEPLITVAAGR
jgi:Fic-DOC domain mobile mystery protein B